jgi:hypothetical protein
MFSLTLLVYNLCYLLAEVAVARWSIQTLCLYTIPEHVYTNANTRCHE